MDLKGKVALVTGGTGGIGRACCEELLKHGAKLQLLFSHARPSPVLSSCYFFSQDIKLFEYTFCSFYFYFIILMFSYFLIKYFLNRFSDEVFLYCTIKFEFPFHVWKVSVCDLDMAEGEQMVKQLCLKYGKDKILFCQCDVTDYPQFEESFQTSMAALGGLDIVVNNAGIMNDRLWELEVDVNLNGMIRGTLLALRFMGKDRGGRGGIVINMGSSVSLRPYVSVPIYTATKHAILGFTRSYGDVFHANMTGVRIVALCPSATDTKLVQNVKKKLLSPDFEKAWQRDTVNSSPQKAESVGRALIQILHKAGSGSVWSVENGQPPYQVNFS